MCPVAIRVRSLPTEPETGALPRKWTHLAKECRPTHFHAHFTPNTCRSTVLTLCPPAALPRCPHAASPNRNDCSPRTTHTCATAHWQRVPTCAREFFARCQSPDHSPVALTAIASQAHSTHSTRHLPCRAAPLLPPSLTQSSTSSLSLSGVHAAGGLSGVLDES